MKSQWHLPGELIQRYATGRLEPVQVMSVETHLSRCAACREAVPYDEEWLATSWERIEDLVDRPSPRPAARLLHRAGVPDHLATFLAATPTPARGWLAAVGAVLTFAVTAAHLAGQDPFWAVHAVVPFLTIAPVLPLAGIALAYGPHVDPVHELQAATPMAGPRLLLLRALAVLVPAVVLTSIAAPFLPGPGRLAAAWLLPALALTAGTLALSTRVSPRLAAGGLVTAWLAALALEGGLAGHVFVFFSPAAQALYGTAAPILAVFAYRRRAHLDPGESRWNRL
ncbi:hypothetical protein GCM10023194_35410 [Planotetraspora phitsanulokensis]|uniref:Zinc-finger domain-containing protein n=1 Tax=Planotetraspora phitsanulokensis TaxID=575192 RepID=A0A8J3U302_9ACTN|nr:zf-HC2 domain-containing protein [Planotetraspora phitsanulokensis]GII36331.1 hypothetical protein Pph01_13340 [Planotetraspora phitsanulokensis]